MTEIRTVTDAFAVAPQLQPHEMGEVAALGFEQVINHPPHRP